MSKHVELQALKQEIMESLHCALPGEVVSYNSEDQTADIQPTIKTRSGRALPLLQDVPVYAPISFDVYEGDVALVVFADMDIDGWIAAGEAAEAASDRKHNLSDGFAFVGFMNDGGQHRKLQKLDTVLSWGFYQGTEIEIQIVNPIVPGSLLILQFNYSGYEQRMFWIPNDAVIGSYKMITDACDIELTSSTKITLTTKGSYALRRIYQTIYTLAP